MLPVTLQWHINATAACVWLNLLEQRFSLGNSVGGDEGHKFGKTSEVTVTWSFSCIGVSGKDAMRPSWNMIIALSIT